MAPTAEPSPAPAINKRASSVYGSLPRRSSPLKHVVIRRTPSDNFEVTESADRTTVQRRRHRYQLQQQAKQRKPLPAEMVPDASTPAPSQAPPSADAGSSHTAPPTATPVVPGRKRAATLTLYDRIAERQSAAVVVDSNNNAVTAEPTADNGGEAAGNLVRSRSVGSRVLAKSKARFRRISRTAPISAPPSPSQLRAQDEARKLASTSSDGQPASQAPTSRKETSDDAHLPVLKRGASLSRFLSPKTTVAIAAATAAPPVVVVDSPLDRLAKMPAAQVAIPPIRLHSFDTHSPTFSCRTSQRTAHPVRKHIPPPLNLARLKALATVVPAVDPGQATDAEKLASKRTVSPQPVTALTSQATSPPQRPAKNRPKSSRLAPPVFHAPPPPPPVVIPKRADSLTRLNGVQAAPRPTQPSDQRPRRSPRSATSPAARRGTLPILHDMPWTDTLERKVNAAVSPSHDNGLLRPPQQHPVPHYGPTVRPPPVPQQQAGAEDLAHVFSGHLRKLSTHNVWQQRLFTYDGNVLVCLKSKVRAGAPPSPLLVPLASPSHPHQSVMSLTAATLSTTPQTATLQHGAPSTSDDDEEDFSYDAPAAGSRSHDKRRMQSLLTVDHKDNKAYRAPKWTIHMRSVRGVCPLERSPRLAEIQRRHRGNSDWSNCLLIELADGRADVVLKAANTAHLRNWAFLLRQGMYLHSAQTVAAKATSAAHAVKQANAQLEKQLQDRQRQQRSPTSRSATLALSPVRPLSPISLDDGNDGLSRPAHTPTKRPPPPPQQQLPSPDNDDQSDSEDAEMDESALINLYLSTARRLSMQPRKPVVPTAPAAAPVKNATPQQQQPLGQDQMLQLVNLISQDPEAFRANFPALLQ
ncbi:hypothetical protein RI367_006565 [Sorochytrium milnesiophthora]